MILFLYPLINIGFWATLSVWFGTTLVSLVAPTVIHRVIREADPTLPRVLSVNLDTQHSTLLAGTVIGELFALLFRLQGVAAVLFLPALVGKWFVIDRGGHNAWLPLLVSSLYLVALILLIYGWRVVWPKVMLHRDQYIENADIPEIANAELDLFDRYQDELYLVVRNLLFVLLGLLLFSASLKPLVL